ncbi:MAG: SDR family oxidoreductase [Proteobacteria bacterium]|nr:SDR family oxidoreductase [Pseudomonadota bacterium]
MARTDSDIQALVEDMGGATKGHFGLAMDLMPQGAPTDLVEVLNNVDFWPIDIVVHNLGGTLDIADPFCSLDDWQRVWRFNIEVAIELNLLIVPPMQERKWGRVVHIASTASVENNGPITYCTVKAALAAYSRSFGRVLAPDGVVVSAVLPGAILTEGGYWDEASRERPEHVAKYLAERCPLHAFGEPDDIGNAVTFLCSDLAGFFQGSIVPVDGGQVRGYFV